MLEAGDVVEGRRQLGNGSMWHIRSLLHLLRVVIYFFTDSPVTADAGEVLVA